MEKNRFQPDIVLKTESNNICSEYSQINKPHNQKDQQIMEFTILRVIAVYLIFVSHTFLFNGEIFGIGAGAFLFSAPAWACIWVLFTLSGYLAGRTFKIGKYYQGGVGQYYYRKMTKIWVPAILFVILYSILCFPGFIPENPTVLIKFLLCTYRGNTTDFTALWYAFTVMALYYLTPAVIFLLNKIQSSKWTILAVFLTIFGLIWRCSTYFLGLDYLRYVYYPLYAAADLYFGGVIFGYSNKPKINPSLKKYSTVFLILCGLFGFFSVYLQWTAKPWLYNGIYSYFGPSLFFTATAIFLISHDENREQFGLPVKVQRGINWLSNYSFEFYMIHSIILVKISPFIQVSSPLIRHILILLLGFSISIMLSIMFHLYSDYLYRKYNTLLDKVFLSTDRLCYWKKAVCLFGGVSLVVFAVLLTYT